MGLLFRGEDFNPLAVGVGDEVQAHAGVLPDDAAHLLVKLVEGVEIVHGECDAGVLAAVVVRLYLAAISGELDLEGRLVVRHEGVGPGAVLGAHLAHHLHAERLLIEPDGCFLV